MWELIIVTLYTKTNTYGKNDDVFWWVDNKVYTFSILFFSINFADLGNDSYRLNSLNLFLNIL